MSWYISFEAEPMLTALGEKGEAGEDFVGRGSQ